MSEQDAIDAARYRWLRDRAHPDADESGLACTEAKRNDWGRCYQKHFSGNALDAAVDAAIANAAAGSAA